MAMEKYILQAPNCWHQFSGRMVGVGVPRRTIILNGPRSERNDAGARGGQVMEIEGGEEEKAAGSMI